MQFHGDLHVNLDSAKIDLASIKIITECAIYMHAYDIGFKTITADHDTNSG